MNFGQYKVSTSDECVNLAVGQPSNNKLPLQLFNQMLINVANDDNYSLLQYGKIEGYYEFRNDFANYLKYKYVHDVSKENIFMTNGITGALQLILSITGRTGMTIFCEDPTYFLALNIFRDFKLNIVPIKMNNDGIDLDELKDKLIELKSETCFLYTIPFYQNPTGISLTHEKKIQLANIADEFPDLIVLSDEVYQFLGPFSLKEYSKEYNIKSLCYYHENFISIGSFSKIFAPSIRLGWINANEKYIKILSNSGIMDSGGCVNPIGCRIMHEFIKTDVFGKEPLLDRIISNYLNFLNNNSQILQKLINEKLVKYLDFTQSCSDGGYFIWLKFKKYISVVELSEMIEEYKIKFHHGNKFSISGKYENYMRLSFSWYENKEDYELFIDRLVSLIQEYLEKKSKQNIIVYMLGYTGKLGNLIADEINKSDNLKIGGNIGRDINIGEISDSNLNVIIDVSSPEGTTKLVTKLLENKKYYPLIIGTTGDLPIDLLEEYSKYAPVGISSNFSKGINQFKKIIEVIDRELWKPSMIEKHHCHKKDKPSGTAKTLMKLYGDEDKLNLGTIISVRKGEIIGEHELILDSENETIKIVHIAKSRKLFAVGALYWINQIIKQSNGIYFNF